MTTSIILYRLLDNLGREGILTSTMVHLIDLRKCFINQVSCDLLPCQLFSHKWFIISQNHWSLVTNLYLLSFEFPNQIMAILESYVRIHQKFWSGRRAGSSRFINIYSSDESRKEGLAGMPQWLYLWQPLRELHLNPSMPIKKPLLVQCPEHGNLAKKISPYYLVCHLVWKK